MQEKILPSGRKILTFEAVASDTEVHEATAMVTENDSTCPKCQRPMGFARCLNERVAYCGHCAVTLPLLIK